MKRSILLAITAFLSLGCSSHQPPLKTVEKVDIQKYLGRWYEIARYEHSFEVGCRNVSANYTLLDDGKIAVLNSCTKEDKEPSEAHGKAYATDDSNARLKVSFFWPFYGDYWVLMLDEAYQYALIGEPSREYLWILSRDKSLDDETRAKILARLPEFGYDAEQLIWTVQE